MLRASVAVAIVVSCFTVQAEDWPRFRGPAGSGIAKDSSIPTEWSANANLAWKTPLPGPGASSPIIVGRKAFVTCYTGYGVERGVGELGDLVRHLVCIDIVTGKKLWQKDVKADLPEDPFSGAGVPAHGYTSHTPVSDGKSVFAFFGKSGLHAYDLEGKKLWDAQVGKETDPMKWGSSSSPIVHKDVVIVVASAESQSIIGFDKKTGKELWRQEANLLDNTWSTPTLVDLGGGRTDVVLGISKEIWGLDPSTGGMRWYSKGSDVRDSYGSVVTEGNRVITVTPGGGSVAVDIDPKGTGDITEKAVAWKNTRVSSGYTSPVLYKGKMYNVVNNVLAIVDASTGDRVKQIRLKGAIPASGQFGALDYPSPILVNDHLYYLNSRGQMYVLSLGEDVKQVAVNRVTVDPEAFRGTPAVSNGRMLLRSSKHLYCVMDKGEKVDPADMKMATVKEKPAADGQQRRRSRQRFDPEKFFADTDKNKDGKLSMEEIPDDRMGNFVKQWDADDDKSITKDEFDKGLAKARQRQQRGYSGEDSRPKRPARPKPAK